MPDDRQELLWRLYEMHVAEYRFQVQLNTQRYQWYTALDVAVITIGTGLLRLSGGTGRSLVALIFAVGASLAMYTIITTARQVSYQHAARDLATKVAAELQITDLAVASTPGWKGGPNIRWTKVRTMNYALLGFLAAVNAIGFVYVVA